MIRLHQQQQKSLNSTCSGKTSWPSLACSLLLLSFCFAQTHGSGLVDTMERGVPPPPPKSPPRSFQEAATTGTSFHNHHLPPPPPPPPPRLTNEDSPARSTRSDTSILNSDKEQHVNMPLRPLGQDPNLSYQDEHLQRNDLQPTKVTTATTDSISTELPPPPPPPPLQTRDPRMPPLPQERQPPKLTTQSEHPQRLPPPPPLQQQPPQQQQQLPPLQQRQQQQLPPPPPQVGYRLPPLQRPTPPHRPSPADEMSRTPFTQESMTRPLQGHVQQQQQRQYFQQQQQQQVPGMPTTPLGQSFERRPFPQFDPQRGPPPGTRFAPSRPPTRSVVAGAGGTIQSLWRRVERRLDDLADLEDVVASRAKKLLSVPHISIPSISLPMRWNHHGNNDEKKDDQESVPWKPPTKASVASQRLQSQPLQSHPEIAIQQENGDKEKETVSNPIVPRSFGYSFSKDPDMEGDSSDEEFEDGDHDENDQKDAKVELHQFPIVESESLPESSQMDPSKVPRKSPWEDLLTGKAKKIMRANGGASSPQDFQSNRPEDDAPRDARYSQQGRPPPRQPPTGDSWQGPGRSPEERIQREGPAQRSPDARGTSTLDALGNPRRSPLASSSTGQDSSFPDSSGSSRDWMTGGQSRAMLNDDEPSTIWSRFVGSLPPLPHLPSLSKLMGRGSGGSYKSYAAASLDAWKTDDDESQSKGWLGGIFRRNQVNSPAAKSWTAPIPSMRRKVAGHGSSSLTPPISDLLARCENGKTSSLLSDQDTRTSRSIGRSRAVLDVMCLGFVLLGVREMAPLLLPVPIPHTVTELTTITLPKLWDSMRSLVDTWAYFALLAAFLTSSMNTLLYDSRVQSMALGVANAVHGAVRYGQVYLRLVASIPIEKHVPQRVQRAASLQFVEMVESARLQSFVTIVLSAIVVMTVSVIRPVIFAIVGAILQIVNLEQWREWPLAWSDIGNGLRGILLPLGEILRDLVMGEVEKVINHPMKIAFTATLFAALFVVALFPMLEQRRPVPLPQMEDDDDEDESVIYAGNGDSLSKLGISSASRLGLLSKSGAMEASLQRWQTIFPDFDEVGLRSLQSTLRLIGYGALAMFLLATPILVYGMTGASTASVSSLIRLDSIMDVSILLCFTFGLVWNAMVHVMDSSNARPAAMGFLKTLAGTVDEFTRLQQSAPMDIQMAASISASKGLGVRDLWAAHTAKRAWAVRGANLDCKNGEVLVILGDDGSGKSRLLTAISEALIVPPRRALSTTKVRGSITFGGLDVSKWDRSQLKKRLGLVLNDVRTTADTAELFSGMTLEEILEPMDGMAHASQPHAMRNHEKNCMSLALQVTGLSTSLIPRLPSKLSTVVTANEDELKPSPLRPRCNILSPSEWSKVLLSRVLVQVIVDNDNPTKSDNTIDKCLIGSLLVLDDVTVHMSEVEEAKLVMSLRKTGAATILTSHKWASGRYADRIAVVKDGTIVESGTHNELLAKGPQHSVYAAKWHAMTSV